MQANLPLIMPNRVPLLPAVTASQLGSAPPGMLFISGQRRLLWGTSALQGVCQPLLLLMVATERASCQQVSHARKAYRLTADIS